MFDFFKDLVEDLDKKVIELMELGVEEMKDNTEYLIDIIQLLEVASEKAQIIQISLEK